MSVQNRKASTALKLGGSNRNRLCSVRRLAVRSPSGRIPPPIGLVELARPAEEVLRQNVVNITEARRRCQRTLPADLAKPRLSRRFRLIPQGGVRITDLPLMTHRIAAAALLSAALSFVSLDLSARQAVPRLMPVSE